MQRIDFFLPDSAATLSFGTVLGLQLMQPAAPRVVLLYGDMGSGKTTLVRSLVEALPGGDQAEVASPSFTLVNEYPTIPPVLHADLFRCTVVSDLPQELEEALDAPCGQQPLILMEWADRLPQNLLPDNRLDIFIQIEDYGRRCVVFPSGEAARQLCRILAEWKPARRGGPCACL